MSDEKLLREIASAAVLVQPSLYEGFGLPPLEALYLGTQPIISDIPVFKEIYGDLPVVFFKTNDVYDLSEKIIHISEKKDIEQADHEQRYSYRNFSKTLLKQLEV